MKNQAAGEKWIEWRVGQAGEPDLLIADGVLLPAGSARFPLLASALPVPSGWLSAFMEGNPAGKQTSPFKKRNLLIVSVITATTVAMVMVALHVPNSLPVNSDFSALYNTTLALVHRIPIYDLEKVEALAVQYAGIPAEDFFLARLVPELTGTVPPGHRDQTHGA